jgi:TRAP transporter TAXI family solute receptor
LGLGLFLSLSAFAAGPVLAQAGKLPETLSATAYDTGTSGFNMAVAIGQMLKNKHGSDLRVLPAGNDVARLAPLKVNRAQFSAMGIGTYFAQEGVLEFAVKDWGPQPLRVMLTATSCNGLSLAATADSGIKTPKDMKGKRLGFVRGSPALNQGSFALIAYSGLTTKDVILVEFSNFGAMWKGMINNEIDLAFASTITGQAKEVENSPRGLFWPEFPAGDKEAWARVNKIAPYFFAHNSTCGAAFAKDETRVLPAYPYPIMMAYAQYSADHIRIIVKAMIDNYDEYKTAVPGIDGFEGKRQKFDWIVPYHDGAVEALKASGLWSAGAQKHNDALVKRQETLVAAWAAFTKGATPDDKDAFRVAWMKARAEALAKAGMDVVFTE